MREGAEIDYRLKIQGLPVRWPSRITVWHPPERCVNAQVRGPYRQRVHEHRLEAPDGTWCAGNVQYALLGGAIINALFVCTDIRKIFVYRSARLQKIFRCEGREASLA